MNNLNFKQIVEEIKGRVDIVDVVSEFVELNRNNKALCPFHDERHPSFSVNPKGQYYYCFSCGVGGDVIDFLKRFNTQSFWEVLKELGRKTGVSIESISDEDKKHIEDVYTIEEILTKSAHYYHLRLTKEVKNYLNEKRAINDEMIEKFQIGFADGTLSNYLLNECKYPLDICLKSGVLRGEPAKDYFFNRIMLPNIRNGRVVYLTGRSLDDSEPKYIHIAGEQRYLYNEEALIEENVIVVEGFFDCVSLVQAGFNAVALMSTNLKDEFVRKFDKCKTVYICLDGDEAGKVATEKLGAALVQKTRIVQLPDNLDPDDFLKSYSREDFDALLNSALDFIRYKLSQISTDTDKTELPKKLEPILLLLNRLDRANSEAFLSHVIKDYFNLKNKDIDAYRQTMKELAKREKEKISTSGFDLPVKYSAHLNGLVDLVLDNGETAFLIKELDKLKIRAEIEEGWWLLLPPPREQVPWLLPKGENVIKIYEQEESLAQKTVDGQLYDDIVSYLKNISELPGEAYYELLAAWVLHTYCMETPQYTPIICLFAVPERGKSRTGKGLIYLVYHGIHVESLRDPYLVRVANDLDATLFFDVKDVWEKAEKEKSEDILLHRFEKGARVPRVNYPERGPHQDIVYYKIFGPTIIATNESVHQILETRAIQINMPETSKRFDNSVTPELAIELKERLIVFRARHFEEQFPEIPKPANGRLGDILRPLLQIVQLVKPEREEAFLRLIKELEKERLIEKADSLEAQILLVIIGLKDRVERGMLPVKDITDKLNENKPDDHKFSYHRVGRRLSALGFRKGKTGDGSSAIIWDDDLTERMKAKYGLNESSEIPETPESSDLNTDNTDVSGDTGVSPKINKNGINLNHMGDSELMDQEDALRNALIFFEKNTPEYEVKYKEWFSYREEGVRRKLFDTFVPASQQELGFNDGGGSSA
ncbi:toprim domain-containing protein [Candidatus Daviesbacteria bacterium]|nr:toprim domain-containing protein [Candidatus Daviesbacteria bacterium]